MKKLNNDILIKYDSYLVYFNVIGFTMENRNKIMKKVQIICKIIDYLHNINKSIIHSTQFAKW